MPAIYGGSSPRVGSLREEEIAEACFCPGTLTETHGRLVVGTLRVEVRREPRGWAGVICDKLGAELFRTNGIYEVEHTAFDRAHQLARYWVENWPKQFGAEE